MGKSGNLVVRRVIVFSVIVALALAVGFLFLIPVTFECIYCREEKEELLVFILSVPLRRTVFQLKLKDLFMDNLFLIPTDNKRYFLSFVRFFPNLQKAPRLRRFLREINKINHYLLKNSYCKKLEWTTVFGLSDAACTAVLTGVIWNLKTLFYYNFRRNTQVKFSYPEFQVKPIFGRPYLSLRFKCIFVIRLGHIIVTAIKFLSVLAFYGLKRGTSN